MKLTVSSKVSMCRPVLLIKAQYCTSNLQNFSILHKTDCTPIKQQLLISPSPQLQATTILLFASMSMTTFFFSHSVMSNSFVTPQTITHQTPLSTGFSRQEFWRRLPFPSPGDLPDPGIKSTSHISCTARQILLP